MKTATNIKLNGSKWINGVRYPGFGQVETDDGGTLYVPESEAIGFNGCVRYAQSHGIDTARITARLDEWVKTGKMPSHA